MHVQGKILVPLLTLFLHTGQYVTADGDGNIEVVMKKLEDPPLQCYRCYEYEEDCLTLANLSNIEVRECERDEIFCKVQRRDNRDVLQTFERSCSRECTPGCQTFLHRTLCVTCCNSSLCNTNSATVCPICTWTWTLVAGLSSVIVYRM